ncbi:hypothetical protein BBP40_004320 [Aspergillus hancockii]|nr:hypothetical protein BBP40_004320 [Aspergillus hancockii]
MVSLEAIRASNQQLYSALPAGLVAVFIGAMSGIAETSMKQFNHSNSPRTYFVGRTTAWADRIKTELKALNPKGTYIFLECDARLLKSVDECLAQVSNIAMKLFSLRYKILDAIPARECLDRDREILLYFAALSYYSRVRFAVNLLLRIQSAPALRRAVTVFAGGKECIIFTDDFSGLDISLPARRGHFASMLTLSFDVLAK